VIFPLNIYFLSAAGAGLTTLISLPLWRRWCRHVGLVDDPGFRKIHEQPIPLAGGLAILTGLLVPLLGLAAALALNLLDPETTDKIGYGLRRRAGQLIAMLAGSISMTLLGWWDDKRELRPALKFAGQTILAVAVAAAGIRITLFIPSLAFSYVVTVLWILTVTNALNFMDNMNGLCTGLGVIASLLIGLISALHTQYLVAGISFLTSGALLGFLPFNFPRASAFLGDAGSHLIGFLLAVLTILPHFYSVKHAHALAVFSPLLILAVPLGDLAWVVILRWRTGKPFYVGDTNHLSHRLVRCGLSPTQAVLVIWILAATVGSLVFLL
jgi:UDP-GlcNAc:undecaprenyl-phosphate GlcNAc-1-phosphate transferase